MSAVKAALDAVSISASLYTGYRFQIEAAIMLVSLAH